MARTPLPTDTRRHRPQEPRGPDVVARDARTKERADTIGDVALLREGRNLLRRRVQRGTPGPPRVATQRSRAPGGHGPSGRVSVRCRRSGDAVHGRTGALE